MGAKLTLEGGDEFAAWLFGLPSRLSEKGHRIVTDTTERAAAEMVAAYPRRTGTLKGSIKTTFIETKGSTRGIVTNTAKHALLFEVGSEARHTALGANRGSMPPGKVMTVIAPRRRKQMNEELFAEVREEGLTVDASG